MYMDIETFEKEYKVQFNDKQLLKQSFTHSSYVNEHQYKHLQDNERLEFLGDAVLELAVSKHIFHKYKTMSEGEMTQLRSALVCEPSLAKIAKDIHFGNYITLGKGEEQTGGRFRPSILADVFEAFLGALYLDQGFNHVIKFLEKHMFSRIKDGAYSHTMDYKSELQEIVQQYLGSMATYDIIAESGPAHNRQFVAQVSVRHLLTATGKGRSKKEAEQQAAKRALDQIIIKDGQLSINRLNS